MITRAKVIRDCPVCDRS